MSNSSEQALNVIEAHIPDLSQSDAFLVFSILYEKYSWSGGMFTPADLSRQIQYRRTRDDLAPLTAEQLEEMTNYILNSDFWLHQFPVWAKREGWDVINEVLDGMEHSNAS